MRANCVGGARGRWTRSFSRESCATRAHVQPNVVPVRLDPVDVRGVTKNILPFAFTRKRCTPRRVSRLLPASAPVRETRAPRRPHRAPWRQHATQALVLLRGSGATMLASRARHGDAQAIRVDRLEHVVHSVNVEGTERVLVECGDENEERPLIGGMAAMTPESVELGHLDVRG